MCYDWKEWTTGIVVLEHGHGMALKGVLKGYM